MKLGSESYQFEFENRAATVETSNLEFMSRLLSFAVNCRFILLFEVNKKVWSFSSSSCLTLILWLTKKWWVKASCLWHRVRIFQKVEEKEEIRDENLKKTERI